MYHKNWKQHVPFITKDKFSKIAHDLAIFAVFVQETFLPSIIFQERQTHKNTLGN